MKTLSSAIAVLLTTLALLCPLKALALEPVEMPQPVPLHPAKPPGWEPLGADGQGSRWFLYQEIKATPVAGVFRVQLDMIPAESNQAYREAGGTGTRYWADVDCGQRTILILEFTAHKQDGTTEHYVYPSSTRPEKPGASSVIGPMIERLCRDR